MKLSFSTLPCEGWTVEELIACCRSCGFDALELKEDSGSPLSLATPEEQLTEAAAQLRKEGIGISNIGSRVILNGISDETRQLQELRQCIRMAQLLGAKGVRVFLGTFFTRKDTPIPAHNLAGIVNGIRSACDYAAPSQVEVWIETHNEFSTGSALRALLDRIGRANCRIVYDVIHPYESGEAPKETVRLLGSVIAHVHMKDGVPFEDPLMHDWKYTLTGEGQLPLAGIVRLLRDSGYQGFYSLEWESKWREEIRRVGLPLEEIFKRYVRLMRQFEDQSIGGRS